MIRGGEGVSEFNRSKKLLMSRCWCRKAILSLVEWFIMGAMSSSMSGGGVLGCCLIFTPSMGINGAMWWERGWL